MTHAWESRVLGGVEQPRIYFIDETNLIINGDFETDVSTGWSWNPAQVISEQASDENAFFGDYIARMHYVVGGSSSTVGWDGHTFDEPPYGETFILTFLARCENENRRYTGQIIFHDNGNDYDIYEFDVGSEWEQKSIIHTFQTGVLNNTIYVNIRPTKDARKDVYVRFDNFKLYKVTKMYDLPQPQKWLQKFDKIIESTNDTIDGLLR